MSIGKHSYDKLNPLTIYNLSWNIEEYEGDEKTWKPEWTYFTIYPDIDSDSELDLASYLRYVQNFWYYLIYYNNFT